MAGQTKLVKTKIYPRPHQVNLAYAHGLETGVNNEATIIPIARYDEGLGSPSSYSANPQNASFAKYDGSNCYPESKVDSINVELNFALTKGALETDKLPAIRCAYMVIATSFLDDLEATDELTTSQVEDLLELQHNTTDRWTAPLFNGVDMPAFAGTLQNLGAGEDGLTTDQKLEGVTFSPNAYYQALQFYTNAPKIRKTQFGLKWFTLTRNHPVKKIRIHIKSKAKYMNPYTFLGVMTYVPASDSIYQYAPASDTTNINHVYVSCAGRYNEWNEKYDMERV